MDWNLHLPIRKLIFEWLIDRYSILASGKHTGHLVAAVRDAGGSSQIAAGEIQRRNHDGSEDWRTKSDHKDLDKRTRNQSLYLTSFPFDKETHGITSGE
jgi:hypothetical protein